MTIFGLDLTNLLGLLVLAFGFGFMFGKNAGELARRRPISWAPRIEGSNEPLLLHCPNQGSWQTGIWQSGTWVDYGTRTLELHPDLYMEIPLSTPAKVKRAAQRALWIITL
jgi:hypothetical protein